MLALSVSAGEVRAGSQGATGVELQVAAGPEDVAALRSFLSPRLEALGLHSVVAPNPDFNAADVARPVPASGDLLARAWIDLRRDRTAAIYLAPSGSDRIVLRTVPLEAGLDLVAEEQIAEILVASLEAVKAGLPVGKPRQDVLPLVARFESRAPPPPPPGRAGASSAFTLGPFVEAQAWSDREKFAPGFGLTFIAERLSSDGWSPGLWFSARYHAPRLVVGTPVGVRLQGGGADLLFALGRSLGRRAALRVAAGPGADFRSAEPVAPAASAPLEMPNGNRELVLGFRLAGAGEVRLGHQLSAFMAFALDTPLLQARYVVDDAGQDRTVFEPWRLRPSVMLGLTWTSVALP